MHRRTHQHLLQGKSSAFGQDVFQEEVVTCGRKVLGLIGKGAFGQVYQALHLKTGKSEVIKVVANSRGAKKEAEILEALPRHPNVVKFMGVSVSSNHIYMFMRYAGHVNLMQLQHQQPNHVFDLNTAINAFYDAADGVIHLHRNGIAHRDIKPENIMVSEDGQTCRVTDLGTAAYTTNALTDSCGSLPFVAPEVLDVGAHGYDGELADCFSMGVLLFEMVYGLNAMMCALAWAGPRDHLLSNKRARAGELRSMLADSRRASLLLRPLLRCGWEEYVPATKQALHAMLCPQPSERQDLCTVCEELNATLTNIIDTTDQAKA